MSDQTPKFDASSLLVDLCRTLSEAKNSKKPISFVMGKDGLYEVRKNGVGVFIVKAEKPIGGDASLKEGFEFALPKVPFKILLQIISLFRDVCSELSDDEAMIQVWWNKTKEEYFVLCPEQLTSKAHVSYIRNQELERSNDMVLVADIHSHNTMNAFFSGTDDSSEKETRLYGVFGRLRNTIPEYKFRMSVGGKFRDISMFEVFERPTIRFSITSAQGSFDSEMVASEKDLLFPSIDYPSEWMETIKRGKTNRSKFASLNKNVSVTANHSHSSPESILGMNRGKQVVSPHNRSVSPSRNRVAINGDKSYDGRMSLFEDLSRKQSGVRVSRNLLDSGFYMGEDWGLSDEEADIPLSPAESMVSQIVEEFGTRELQELIDLLCEQGSGDLIAEVLKRNNLI